jgi:hypothetical protein
VGAVVVVIVGSPLWPPYLFPLSSSGDRVRLLLHASLPSANLFAMSIRSDESGFGTHVGTYTPPFKFLFKTY